LVLMGIQVHDGVVAAQEPVEFRVALGRE